MLAILSSKIYFMNGWYIFQPANVFQCFLFRSDSFFYNFVSFTKATFSLIFTFSKRKMFKRFNNVRFFRASLLTCLDACPRIPFAQMDTYVQSRRHLLQTIIQMEYLDLEKHILLSGPSPEIHHTYNHHHNHIKQNLTFPDGEIPGRQAHLETNPFLISL